MKALRSVAEAERERLRRITEEVAMIGTLYRRERPDGKAAARRRKQVERDRGRKAP